MSFGNPNYFYTEDGLRIFYKTNFDVIEPNETVLIFNYGLVCNNAHWEKQLPYFEKLGFKILIHDYRFHYGSSSSDDIKDCTFDKMVQDLYQLTQSLNIRSAILLGHSMGVNITLEFALRYPEITKGIVLISGTVLPPHDVMFDSNIMEIATPYIQWFTEKYPTLFEKIWKTSHLNPIARIVIHKGGFNTKKVPEEFVQTYMTRISQLPPDIFLQLFNEMKQHKILQHLESIKCPSLIMGGDKDQVIPNHLQFILSDYLPNSKLYIIKDGSHVPQADFPATVNERIKLFINSILI